MTTGQTPWLGSRARQIAEWINAEIAIRGASLTEAIAGLISSDRDRLGALERQVAEQRAEIDRLKLASRSR